MNKKASVRAIDEPLSEPGADLLEMDQHAKALADYIRQDRKLPFTIGIFGEWGEGKTTMVNFVKNHLTPPAPPVRPPSPFNFVSFSAWPYTTSEKLWRALILEIAKVLYHVDTQASETDQANRQSDSNSGRKDLIGKFTAFLHGDLFRRNEPAPELTRFEKLVKQLDRTDYGKISRRTPNTALDQEAVMSAVVSGALSVLGTVSPLAAGIRSFLPWESKLNAEPSNETTEETSNEEVNGSGFG
jgi:hypothetical protein